jgi:hypothetical protein
MNEKPPSLLPKLAPIEWAPVVMVGVTAWYLFLNAFAVPRGEMGIDPLPVLSGVLIIPFVWLAIQRAGRVERAVEDLLGAGSMVALGNANASALRADLTATVTRWAWIGAAAVGLLCFAVTLFSILLSQDGLTDAGWLAMNLLLLLVMVAVGAYLGFILGRLAGYGNLASLLERHNFRLAGLSTPEATRAMRSLEGVYTYAIAATLSICGFCDIWWIVWHLGYDPFDYRGLWQTPYIGFWLAGFAFFLLCGWRPARAFNGRLDRIYGGAEARRGLEDMLRQAQEDIAALAKRPHEAAEKKELEDFIRNLQARTIRSRFTDDRVLVALIIANLLVAVLPLVFGHRLPGGL